MHRLSYIKILNFRSCRKVSIPLGSYTPLVGQNNAGKTSIQRAIKWVLCPSALSSGDFCDREQEVVVSAQIVGITSALLEQIPDPKHRTAISPYCRDGVLWIRASSKGTRASEILQEVWEVDEYTGDGVPDQWRKYPTGLPAAVSALLPEPLFVSAMDDVTEDLGKSKAGTTIKLLLDEVMRPILVEHVELQTALDTIRDYLSLSGGKRSKHLVDFDEKATDVITRFFPGLAISLDLQIVDLKEFFKVGDLQVTDLVTDDKRRFDEMGTGTQRAIQMALIRYLAQTRTAKDAGAPRRLLLIDEPELYLHPQGICRLREALRDLSLADFQVIFSTHSPLMLSRENAADTVLVLKSREEGTSTRTPMRSAVEAALADAESQSRVLFELGNLADIYFSERVVLCEGKTDRRLLPLAYRQVFGKDPDLDGIAFVSLGGAADIPKALPVLAAMEIKACAVVDLDFAFVEGRKGGNALLPKNGADIERAKEILQRIQPVHGFTLGANGLPSSKGSQVSASDAWAFMAADGAGGMIAESVHSALKARSIWVWKQGSVEDVIGYSDKGEDAIIEQENRLRKMTVEEVKFTMPEVVSCLEWIRSL